MFSYGQTIDLHFKLNILPELKELLKDEKISLTIFCDPKQEITLINSDTTSFRVQKFDSLVLLINCNITKGDFFKEYHILSVLNNDTLKSSLNLSFEFPKRCQFNLQGINKSCPKCHKTDEVLPICYGLPIYNEKGEAFGPKCHTVGCIISDCDPTWYCNRDQLSF